MPTLTSEHWKNFWATLVAKAREENENLWAEQGSCPALLNPVLEGSIEGFKIKSSDLKYNVSVNSLPSQTVVCEWEVRWDDSGWKIRIVKGGVTGWEGWYLYSLVDAGIFEQTNPFVCACGGTPNRWDALYLNRFQLQQICRQAQALEIFPT